MADPAALHVAFAAALEAITVNVSGTSFFDSDVPKQPPREADGDRVLPYILLLGNAGAPPSAPGQRGLTELTTTYLQWTPTVVVASGHPAWTLGAVGLVRSVAGALVLPGGARLRETTAPGLPQLINRNVTPPRYIDTLGFFALTAD